MENGQNEEVIINYSVYANRTSVAVSNISKEKAFLAPTDLFMFPENEVNIPINLTVNLPESWKEIATGLKELNDSTFFAENFNILYDSPLYLGNQKMIEFQQLGKHITLSIVTPEGLKEQKFVSDLSIRHETKNKKSLDDVMRYLYNHYYRELGRGYTEGEFWKAIQNYFRKTFRRNSLLCRDYCRAKLWKVSQIWRFSAGFI